MTKIFSRLCGEYEFKRKKVPSLNPTCSDSIPSRHFQHLDLEGNNIVTTVWVQRCCQQKRRQDLPGTSVTPILQHAVLLFNIFKIF